MPGTLRRARRVTIKVRPESVDKFLSAMRGRVYPGLTREDGIRRVYLLRSLTSPNEFASLTLWDDIDDADSYESKGHFSANTDLIREYLLEEPVLTQWEVAYHKVNPELPPPSSARKSARKARKKTTAKSRRK